jgi:hypothetical protein
LVVWCLLASSATAADREVRLSLSAPILKGVEAFPRIADPVDDAERNVNLALDRLDRAVQKAAQDCQRTAPGRAPWERMLSVPIVAPGFLSLHFIDGVFCGGTRPSYKNASIVYDLRSGRPVDWTMLLPPALTGEVAPSKTSDGSEIRTLSSARLHRLYLDQYRRRADSAGADEDDVECREAVATLRNGQVPRMMVWFKGREGLSIQFDLEYAAEACADEVIIPVATLRAEGASADLVRALEAARPAQIDRPRAAP